jgi:hypothetical protein
MDIPAQTIEPGHDDRRTKHRGGVQCGRQLRSPVQRIGSLTRLDLNVAVAEVQALGGTKVLNGLALAFQSETGTTLFIGTNSRRFSATLILINSAFAAVNSVSAADFGDSFRSARRCARYFERQASRS